MLVLGWPTRFFFRHFVYNAYKQEPRVKINETNRKLTCTKCLEMCRLKFTTLLLDDAEQQSGFCY